VRFSGRAELRDRLAAWGIPASDADATPGFLVLDGDGNMRQDARDITRNTLGNGGTVFILVAATNRHERSQQALLLNDLLPAPVAFTDRTATALEAAPGSPFAAADLYFAEEESPDARLIMRRGLSGPFVKNGRILLTASRTDWSLFNRRSEEEKCGALFCYENLIKPDGAALVSHPVGQGTLILCTVDPTPDTPARRTFWRKLFATLGVQVVTPQPESGAQKSDRSHDLLLDGPQQKH
jgi:hypothetical protein